MPYFLYNKFIELLVQKKNFNFKEFLEIHQFKQKIPQKLWLIRFLDSRCYCNDIVLEYYDDFHYALFSNSLLKSLDMA